MIYGCCLGRGGSYGLDWVEGLRFSIAIPGGLI